MARWIVLLLSPAARAAIPRVYDMAIASRFMELFRQASQAVPNECLPPLNAAAVRLGADLWRIAVSMEDLWNVGLTRTGRRLSSRRELCHAGLPATLLAPA